MTVHVRQSCELGLRSIFESRLKIKQELRRRQEKEMTGAHFLKGNFQKFIKFHRIPIKYSAKVIFRHQKYLLEQIAPGPLKTKLKREENPPRIHFSVQKSLLRKKSLLAAKVAKVRKVISERKVAF